MLRRCGRGARWLRCGGGERNGICGVDIVFYDNGEQCKVVIGIVAPWAMGPEDLKTFSRGGKVCVLFSRSSTIFLKELHGDSFPHSQS